jgi:hypothetical protein
MGLNQGYNKYTQGYSRYLTKSELDRGYLFISKDKKINSIPNLTVRIDDELYTKPIDSSGRIFAGAPILQKIGSKEITYRLEGNVIIISY